MKHACNAVLTEYIVSRSMDKLNNTVTNNIGLLYDVDDDKSGFDTRPLCLDNSMRSSMKPCYIFYRGTIGGHSKTV